MTENNSLVIEVGSDPQSLSYTPDAPEPKAAPEAKPLSSREALEKAADELEAKGTKIGNDEEAKPEVKPEPKPRAEGGKFAKAETAEVKPEPTKQDEDADPEANAEGEETGQEDGTKDRSSEDRDIDKPPAQFLPRSKEKWSSVDPDIRSEVRRMEAEFQKGKELSQEDRQYRKDLREFDEMAKQHGTTVKDALRNYTAIDNLLKSDPLAGIERILQSVGITKEQYAHHVNNAPQQPPSDPKVSQLEQTVRQLQQQLQGVTQTTQQSQQEAQLQQVRDSIIEPFRASLGDDDRYEELEEDIAFFLNSDKIPSTLSAQKRLAAAYDMAERINPLGYSGQNTERLRPANADRPLKPAGAKSIKGAPNGTSVPKSANLSTKEAIDASMRALGF